ncbi:MAG: hypothetical protein K2X81_00495, partial [Candidatus Obscuribacterales bacterium]|nr:hypothetical protein [Candidatus Obscuribacterales bacterium]
MSYQTIALLIVFFIGAFASSFQSQALQEHARTIASVARKSSNNNGSSAAPQIGNNSSSATAPQPGNNNVPAIALQPGLNKIAARTQAQSAEDSASTLLDYGQGEKSSKMFHEILQNDLKEPEAKKARIAIDLNNEAVALYLSARSQKDPKRGREFLLLARNCLATAQTMANQFNLNKTQLAVSYNQYMVIDL